MEALGRLSTTICVISSWYGVESLEKVGDMYERDLSICWGMVITKWLYILNKSSNAMTSLLTIEPQTLRDCAHSIHQMYPASASLSSPGQPIIIIQAAQLRDKQSGHTTRHIPTSSAGSAGSSYNHDSKPCSRAYSRLRRTSCEYSRQRPARRYWSTAHGTAGHSRYKCSARWRWCSGSSARCCRWSRRSRGRSSP